MHECFEINSPEELDRLAPEWQDLLAATPRASFFQSCDWLRIRWQHAKPNEDHFVVGIREGDQLTGLIPFMIAPMQTKVGEMMVARFPFDGWGSFYGPISANPQGALQQATDYLVKSGRKFDFMELTPMADPGSQSRHVEMDEPVTTIELLGQKSDEDTRVGMLDLTDDWETYWKSRAKQKNRRRNVERCERRLNELGEIRWERHRPNASEDSNAEDYMEVFDKCEAISKLSWQKDLVNGNTLHHADVNAFLRDVHSAAVRAGALDASLLFLDDRPIAFMYGYHFNGYVDQIRIGFDPEFSKLAPGNALWSRMIRDSFERGDRVLDLGPTCLDYKRFWITRLEPGYSYCRYVSLKSQAQRAVRSLKSLSETGAPITETNQGNRQLAMENQNQAT